MALEHLESRVVLSTINWDSTASPAGGDWNTAANWVGGVVPGVNDDAVIDIASGTVTFSVADLEVGTISTSATTKLEIASGTLGLAHDSTFNGDLIVDGGTLALDAGYGDNGYETSNLTVNGRLNWTSGTVGGTGTLGVHGGMTLGSTDPTYVASLHLDSATLINYGDATLATGANAGNAHGILLSGGEPAILNYSTFRFINDASISNGQTDYSQFENFGTVTTNGGDGTSILSATRYYNYGEMSAQTGTLSVVGFAYEGLLGDGSILTAASGATLAFNGGTAEISTGATVTTSGDGVVAFLGGATIRLYGTLTANSRFDLNGAILGAGDFTANADFNFTGGTLGATTSINGSLHISPNDPSSSLGGVVISGTVENYGAATMDSGPDGITFPLSITGSLTNEPPAGLTLTGHTTIDGSDLINQGTILVTGSDATPHFGANLSNSGTLRVKGGTLTVDGGLTNTGTLTLQGGTIAVLGSFVNSETVDVDTGTLNVLDLSPAGSSTLAPATYIVGGSILASNTYAISDNQANVTLIGSGFIGGIGGQSSFRHLQSNAVGSLSLKSGATLVTDQDFVNAAPLTIGQGSSFSTTGGFTQGNLGSTILAGGKLAVGVNGIQINAGSITGDGTITGNVTNDATIEPGGEGTPGILTIQGSYTQLASGTLAVDIGGDVAGTSFDQLNVTGTATLGATLDVSLVSGYVPPIGAKFVVIKPGSLVGTFDTLNGLDLGDRLLNADSTSNAFTLLTGDKLPAEPFTAIMSDDGLATVFLVGYDVDTAAADLSFTIDTLPDGTLLRADGSAVHLGDTFSGSPVRLTYVMPTITAGDFTDQFNFSTSGTSGTLGSAKVTVMTPSDSANTIRVGGTSGDDNLFVFEQGKDLAFTLNGVTTVSSIIVKQQKLEVFGRTGNDTIEVSGDLPIGGTLDGGSGSNTLVGDVFNPGYIVGPFFRINGTDSGFVSRLTGEGPVYNFSNFGSLVGPNSGGSLFKFGTDGSLSGSIDGGSGVTCTLDYSTDKIPGTIDLTTMTATRIAGHFVNISFFYGSSAGGNQLIGPSDNSKYSIDTGNIVHVGSYKFVYFDSITAGSGNDTFTFAPNAVLKGSIDGGGGTNTLDYSSFSTLVKVNLTTMSASRLGGTFANIQTVLAGSVKGQLTGPNSGATFNITGPDTATVAGLTAVGFNTLFGGEGKDTFVFSPAGTLSNSIDGFGGTNAIDYSSFTTTVFVDLQGNQATNVAFSIVNIRYAHGGSGDDTLIASDMGSVLVGGGGNDTLDGGSGRDLLIGGLGEDTLDAKGDDDILIGGTTSYDDSFAALDSILTQWKSTYYDYNDRIGYLTNGGGVNGSNTLNWGSTVIDDHVADLLDGRSGTDWFFQGTEDTSTPMVPNK